MKTLLKLIAVAFVAAVQSGFAGDSPTVPVPDAGTTALLTAFSVGAMLLGRKAFSGKR